MINNWQVSSLGNDFSHSQTALASLGFSYLGFSLLKEDAFKIINNQKLRWWLTPIRVKRSFSSKLSYKDRGTFRAETFDISKTGAFFLLKEDSSLIKYAPGQKLGIRIYINEMERDLCLQARVVRVTNAKGIYPEGIGVQFENMSLSMKKVISNLIEKETRFFGIN